jgi:hypothetical protein
MHNKNTALVLLLLLAMVASVQAEGHQYRIVVDANEELGTVSPLLYGQNYGPWMETSPEYIDAYQQAHINLLRFPAGEWGDENYITRAQLDELAFLAQELNAEVSVQTRLFPDGTPEAAARLVHYANIENQYGFQYWEIGNEPDLYNERDEVLPEDPFFDAEWYSFRYREFHTAMKAVDPSILIAGPVVTIGWEEWMPTFIYLNGDIIDIISWHWYGHGDELDADEVLALANDIEHQIETIRFWWYDPETNPTGYQRPIPPLYISEYGVSAASTIYEHLGTQIAALWAAEVVGRMANSGVEMAAHFALQGTHWHGLINGIYSTRPIYGVYQLYTHWGQTQISTQSSDEISLPAFASKSDDQSIVVMIINQDPEQEREVEILLRGVRLSGSVKGWRLNQEGEIITLPEEAAGSSYTANLPPYTITLFSFGIAPESRIILNAFIILMVIAVLVYFVIRLRAQT